VISRRALCAGAAFALVPRSLSWQRSTASGASWRPRELGTREVAVEGTVSRLFVLGTPLHLAPFERVPLLVLLHGLGETGDARTGAWAWFERYGLGTAYDGLCAAPSFRGLVVACPYMPNLALADPHALDEYASWIVESVVPAARRATPFVDSSRATLLGGCSLGGHFSLEVLLRRPEAFSAWAGVQTAIGEVVAARFAQRLAEAVARVGPRDLLVETSTEDPFRLGNETLSKALTRAGQANRFIELPGPHDQAWLRTAGTPSMLQWFDELPRGEQRPAPLEHGLVP
jgi:iron(III)-salmochelin esterase